MYLVKREHGKYENNPNEIVKRKNIVLEIKNKFDGINSRLDTAEGKTIPVNLETWQ